MNKAKSYQCNQYDFASTLQCKLNGFRVLSRKFDGKSPKLGRVWTPRTLASESDYSGEIGDSDEISDSGEYSYFGDSG